MTLRERRESTADNTDLIRDELRRRLTSVVAERMPGSHELRAVTANDPFDPVVVSAIVGFGSR